MVDASRRDDERRKRGEIGAEKIYTSRAMQYLTNLSFLRTFPYLFFNLNKNLCNIRERYISDILLYNILYIILYNIYIILTIRYILYNINDKIKYLYI